MKRVLIAGASVAGPALAYCLARHEGFQVTVVERAAALRPGGQAVDFRGPGRELLRKIGLDERIRAARTETLGVASVDRDGREISREMAHERGGDGTIAEIEILRGDLAQLMYEETAGTAEYRFGDHIVGLEQTADHVTARFASGLREDYDIVVGADGLRSSLRSLVFGPHDRYLHDLGLLIGFFTAPNHLELDRWALNYTEGGAGGAVVRSIRDNREASVLLAVRGDRRDCDSRDVAGQQAFLRERMGGLGWEIPRLLDMMDASDDFYFDTCSLTRMPVWSAGRVMLLGDAAHCASPTSGQGTNQAFIGAYVLAGELAKSGGEHAAAFDAYERIMRDYVAGNQGVGQENAQRFGSFRDDSEIWIEDHQLSAIRGIQLPDYLAA
ncbi:FAD-dependent oxidoreductase [Pseudonocardiaceae bacterium YIM PH 21723]|nr:FAD-dependent oxidoreductase [Pseudonocardiaceae bacterium YIM PH 21723]